MSNTLIAGLDEVGRGPLAGPVVAAACVITQDLAETAVPYPHWHPLDLPQCRITDSKKLSAIQRERSAQWIHEYCLIGIGIVSAEEIDIYGIVPSTNRAMMIALEELRRHCEPTHLFIDGRDKFTFPLPAQSFIKGDSLHPQIAAASIVAKVLRDALMTNAAHAFPQYGFDGHKGYGAAAHIEAIKQFGPTPLHRRSFLKNILAPAMGE